ncbi:hypothetical protein IAT38_001927 [Cryptococcus sp. DSM 104549]
MPTTLYSSHVPRDETDDSLFFSSVSPHDTLFPPEISAPFSESSYLHIPASSPGGGSGLGSGSSRGMSGGASHSHRDSISSNGDHSSYLSLPQSVGSSNARLPSLSPSSQEPSIRPSSHSSHSPHSSASPHSTFSNSATDDALLHMSYNTSPPDELDMLFLADPAFAADPLQEGQKPGQTLFLPGHRSTQGSFSADLGRNDDWIQNLFRNAPLSAGANPPAGFGDDAFGLMDLGDAQTQRQQGQQQQQQQGRGEDEMAGFDLNQIFAGLQQHQQQQQQQQQQGQTIQPQMVKQEQPVATPQLPYAAKQEWNSGAANGQQSLFMNNGVQNGNFQFNQQPFSEDTGPDLSVRRSSLNKGSLPVQPRPAPTARRTPAVAKLPTPKPAATGTGTDAPAPVGKHNKTERRYRQKVQAAQADLRDAIPALRVLYDTSTEEQKLTTDVRAADGTVDGLGEVTRPNASAKATILIGARMYIELLQRRSAMLQRKVDELEAFRVAVGGEEDMRRWQEEFAAREAEIQRKADEAAAVKEEEESMDDAEEEEEEEEGPKRKRAKAAPKPRAKPGPKGKAATSAVANGARVFAAFAMSFSLVPSSTKVYTPATPFTTSQVLSANLTTTQILSRLPLITAEHTSRLIGRALPEAVTPGAHTLVDWCWRLMVAVLLVVSMGPLIAKWTKVVDGVKVGRVEEMVKDVGRMVVRREVKGGKRDGEAAWEKLAAEFLGGVSNPTGLARAHIILHLNGSASTPYSLALLALLQPELPIIRTPEQIWHTAQSLVTPSTPPALATVLKLPFHETQRCLESLPVTASPIAAIAEQITLVHIHDLYSRLFIHLVEASTKSTLSSASVHGLLADLEATNLGASLTSSAFDKEIRSVVEGVPKGSPSHALGLVLIGLWGIFTGPSPSAQAALASALAADEIHGTSSGLASTPAMLELLYPGSTASHPLTPAERSAAASLLSSNARAVDNLAVACIEYIQLLLSAAEASAGITRLQRLEKSRSVQRATARLRLVLTQTKFVGMDAEVFEDEEDEFAQVQQEEGKVQQQLRGGLESESEKFERAKVRLVEVLCRVGRRAAGRASGRDEDSGLEGDLDEL